ncbi:MULTISPECIES: cupin domain-containing protein [Fischerella]|uniref:Cupin domain-containing protein n=1 Tax=Fischerella muscicola CCMEE 5323 TaxID=2019572 RepID=A0A2N6K0H3_FISMU|nr:MULTISPECIES: cupin domain-containing protein [Fischerella]MBD2432214.1 cupin domain-containing protein [Fischerella sp. FACHB-380]PLZ87572.1 cupin domain-containing protein [Fischerella muscicola CCMEE 5323]
MTSTTTTNSSFVKQLREEIAFTHTGVVSKLLFQDNACQYTLFCLAANTEISEHTSTRNATINVLEGRGLLTLSGEEIALVPGVFVFMPANSPHALKAEENLAFLLTLSEKVIRE